MKKYSKKEVDETIELGNEMATKMLALPKEELLQLKKNTAAQEAFMGMIIVIKSSGREMPPKITEFLKRMSDLELN